jgi:signal transduction histidine kinase
MSAAAAVLSRFGVHPWLVLLLALTTFGSSVFWVSQRLRDRLQAQVVAREGEVLSAVTLTLAFGAEADLQDPEFGASSADQLDLILRASQRFEELAGSFRTGGILAARLFDARGTLVTTFPVNVAEATLSADDLKRLQRLAPLSRYYPQARLADYFWQLPGDSLDDQRAVPLLEVTIPLHRPRETKLLGIAQFVLDGSGIATLSRELARYGIVAFAGGGLIIALSLSWAFHRLERSRRLLAERTASLLQANHELTLAAKTSAVGAVASHLIHGLKSPLFGLHHFVASRSNGNHAAADAEWRAAVETTQRMQAMIAEVVRVLREETAPVSYRLSLEELIELVAERVVPKARSSGVHFSWRTAAQGSLSNRQANLVLLILENLLHNAIQATPAGNTVHLCVQATGPAVTFTVSDQGPGLPDAVRAALFQPVQSTKPDGAGIGLAISKQLAKHLGAELELKESSARGCVFALTLPAHLLVASAVAEVAAEG